MALKKPVSIIIAVIVLAALAGAAYMTRGSWMHLIPGGATDGGFRIVTKDGARYKESYTCPMHPQIIKPGPGDCPICGMTLVKKLIPAGGEAQKPVKPDAGPFEVVEKGGAFFKQCWVCPMHPDVVKPGQEPCPICGMDLMKEEVPMEGAAHEGHEGMAGMDDADMASLESVSLDPRARLLANVATTKVVYSELSGEVYTVGRVMVNEDTIRKATAWFPGRIERMYVHYPGEHVTRGQRIMSVYSPELVATQKEYLVAKDAAERLSSSGFPEVTRGTNDVVEAARKRMSLWGVTDEQIKRLDDTGVPDGNLDVYSKVSGTVTDIMAREGAYVMEGGELFTVADYGSVWVNAEVYEYEFSKVSMGAHAEITADAYPGRAFHGSVSFIDPVVDRASRTVRVRAVVQNGAGLLKPEMFVNARIMTRPRKALTVPASAVLYTGRRNVVWVEVSPGTYEPSDVRLGLRSGDEYEVLSGLSEGDVVVSEGGFLIDSEAELRRSAGGGAHAGHAGMAGMDDADKPAPAQEMPAGHRH